jgi:gliding motility-associated-like protein
VVTDLNGCTDTDCVTLSIEEPCGDVYIPSAFSPDGTNDPENDRFCVYGRCITTLNLQVYDRWGKLVFESNDPSGCWDGTFKGSQVNTGVYMYVAKVSLANGQNTVIKGDVTLMR